MLKRKEREDSRSVLIACLMSMSYGRLCNTSSCIGRKAFAAELAAQLRALVPETTAFLRKPSRARIPGLERLQSRMTTS